MLEEFFPEIKVVGMADSVETGVLVINEHAPEIAFLDVQLTDGTSFEILEQLDYSNLSVVFTTAYDQYAIKAFRFSAVDYLLKPIDIDELKAAVAKVIANVGNGATNQQIDHLMQNVNRDPGLDPMLLISTAESIEFVDIHNIIRCQADSAYCNVYLKNGQRLVASKVIKEFELLLEGYGFFRVHQSHLVNLRELKKYSRSENLLILKDGSRIQLARSRKDNFFKELSKLKI